MMASQREIRGNSLRQAAISGPSFISSPYIRINRNRMSLTTSLSAIDNQEARNYVL